ncbi:MAG: CPBP family intramembrane metalloprotease [Cyclobacteriaceae bacterium]
MVKTTYLYFVIFLGFYIVFQLLEKQFLEAEILALFKSNFDYSQINTLASGIAFFLSIVVMAPLIEEVTYRNPISLKKKHLILGFSLLLSFWITKINSYTFQFEVLPTDKDFYIKQINFFIILILPATILYLLAKKLPIFNIENRENSKLNLLAIALSCILFALAHKRVHSLLLDHTFSAIWYSIPLIGFAYTAVLLRKKHGLKSAILFHISFNFLHFISAQLPRIFKLF